MINRKQHYILSMNVVNYCSYKLKEYILTFIKVHVRNGLAMKISTSSWSPISSKWDELAELEGCGALRDAPVAWCLCLTC